MSSASGLSNRHRLEAKKLFVKYAELTIAHRDDIHYVHPSNPAGMDRWEGIHKRIHMSTGAYPHHMDCSSGYTDIMWNIWVVHFGLGIDRINGLNWQAGNTGSIAAAIHRGHAKQVHHLENVQVGDALLWGPAPGYEHVAGSVGGDFCWSMGSEPGPLHLTDTYRGPPDLIVRFI